MGTLFSSMFPNGLDSLIGSFSKQKICKGQKEFEGMQCFKIVGAAFETASRL